MTSPEYELLAKIERPARTSVQMNIPVVEDSEATGALADAYQHFRTNFGRPDVPGILKCFGSSPKLLMDMMEMSSTLLFADGSLGRRRKEMIASYVSRLNACPYCLDSHAFFLRVHGGGEAVGPIIEDRLDSPGILPAERLLLEFAAKVNGASHQIVEEDTQTLRDAGWSDEQIAEVVHIAAAFALFNRVANAFGLVSQGLLDLKPEIASAPASNV